MKLNALRLRHFKGARKFDVEPRGANTNIYGDNAAGKTTLADAWFWLLFNKDSLNRADFEIKTIVAGEPLHNHEHSVEAEIEHESGRVTLKKVYKETWTTKRSSAVKEFTGHETAYFVDTVPVQKKEYDNYVAGICSEGKFRLLTDPRFFNEEMKWQDRRRVLIEICGDITDADVIASNPELQKLPAILGTHSLDNYRKIIAARRPEIRKAIDAIPVRIDEAARSIPSLPDGAVADYESKLVTLRASLRSLEEKRASTAAGGAIAEKRRKIAELEGEMITIANGLKSGGNDARNQALELARQKDAAIRDSESDASSLRRRVSNLAEEKTRLEARLPSLRDEYETERAKAWQGSESCATCGQSLPGEKVEAAKSAFNQAKSERLKANNATGREIAGKIADVNAQIVALGSQVEALDASIATLRAERAAIVIPEAETINLGSNPAYAEKLRTKGELEYEINQLQGGTTEELQRIDDESATVRGRIQEADGAIALFQRKAETETRIKELGAEKKALAAEFERSEHELFLTEEFVRTKVSMLTTKINSRFKIARWKLFEDQINGGLSETCEVTVNGVPFGSLNHGMRVNVGLDIINVLGEHYGFTPPIFIDNAESVTALLPTKGQQIRLIVSAADKVLRTEITRASAQEALI